MKSSIVIVVLLLSWCLGSAQTPQSITQEGNRSFVNTKKKALPPVVLWEQPRSEREMYNAENGFYRVSFCVQSEGVGFSYRFLVNGAEFRQRGTGVRGKCAAAWDEVVPLAEGDNVLEVEASNAGGTVRSIRQVRWVREPTPQYEKRLALLIGNATFKNAELNLNNPLNDVDSMERALRSMGFEVLKHKNVSQDGMKDIIRKFSDKMRNYQVGLFYFAGHGAEVSDKDDGDKLYLSPSSIKSDFETKADVKEEGIATSWIQDQLQEGGKDKQYIVILDACRSKARCVQCPPIRLSAPSGMFMAYATLSGKKTLDGIKGKNGLFTAILLKHIRTRGLTLEQVFKRTRNDLLVNHQQESEEINRSLNDFYFVK